MQTVSRKSKLTLELSLECSHLQIEDHSTLEVDITSVHHFLGTRFPILDFHVSDGLLGQIDARVTFLRFNVVGDMFEASLIILN